MGLRRLRVWSDRLRVMADAWTTLAVTVTCFRILYDEVMRKKSL